jgi:hypothetical protein
MRTILAASACALGLASSAAAQQEGQEYKIETRFGMMRIYLADGKTQVEGLYQGRRVSSSDPSASTWVERVGLEESNGRQLLRFDGPGASSLLLVHDLEADGMPEEARKGWQELLPGMIQRVDGHYRIPTAIVWKTSEGNTLIGGFKERIPLH